MMIRGTKMQRTPDGNFILTETEIKSLSYFIDVALGRQFDFHSDYVICECSWEEGKEQMNPEMYKMQQEMDSLLRSPIEG
jgi:hypothetical protein